MTTDATMPEVLRSLLLDVACILLGVALALLVPSGFSAPLLPDPPPPVTPILGG